MPLRWAAEMKSTNCEPGVGQEESAEKIKAQKFTGNVVSFVPAPKPESQDLFFFLIKASLTTEYTPEQQSS